MDQPAVDALLASPEPSLRWLVRTRVLGQPAAELTALREEIRGSATVRRLLAPFAAGEPPPVYAYWQGAHWVLAALADLGYPPGDEALHPLRDQVADAWLAERYRRDLPVTSKASSYGKDGIPVLAGRPRAHASQQGNALRSLVTLGLADERRAELAGLLLRWQWPDGGWNCDREPAAAHSSFFETLLPMRGLQAYGTVHGDAAARSAARAAAEMFLRRRLAWAERGGGLIRDDFLVLHYPAYWYYDLLAGLTGMAELGLLGDPRCADALDVLESLRVPGGWPSAARWFRPSDRVGRRHDWVDWGGASIRRVNPWVTVHALAVLREAGRLAL